MAAQSSGLWGTAWPSREHERPKEISVERLGLALTLKGARERDSWSLETVPIRIPLLLSQERAFLVLGSPGWSPCSSTGLPYSPSACLTVLLPEWEFLSVCELSCASISPCSSVFTPQLTCPVICVPVCFHLSFGLSFCLTHCRLCRVPTGPQNFRRRRKCWERRP